MLEKETDDELVSNYVFSFLCLLDMNNKMLKRIDNDFMKKLIDDVHKNKKKENEKR